VSDARLDQQPQTEQKQDEVSLNPSSDPFKTVWNLLANVSADRPTLATLGPPFLRLPDHGEFKDARFDAELNKARRVEDLLELERDLMVEVERIEAMERALHSSTANGAKLSLAKVATIAKDLAEQSDALFDHLMTEVKAKDRELETAVQSFRTFLSEGNVSGSGQEKFIYVLNYDPQKLAEDPAFGIGTDFGEITRDPEIERATFGLWVLGAKATTSDEIASIGQRAARHTALAVMNIDSEKLIDGGKRLDFRQETEGGATAAEQLALVQRRNPLAEKDIAWMDRTLSKKEGSEAIVLGFSPIRIRKKSRYEEDQGDVTVPSSFAIGGKIFFVAMVSSKEGLTSSISRPEEGFEIGSYAVAGDENRGDYGPFLYDVAAVAKELENRPIVTGIVSTVKREDQPWGPLAHFAGQHSAAGKQPENLISSILAYNLLQRIMIVLGREANSKPKENRAEIRSYIQQFLVQNLATGPRKMFTRIEVEDDRNSEEGQKVNALGGIHLIVRAEANVPISDVSISIMPFAEETTKK
jgi:hypothetical protein